MKKPKIIATVGPASENILQEMQNSGVEIFRLNFSHADKNWHKKQITKIKKLKNKAKIMLDTRGPEIRTGKINNPIQLKKGDRLTLITKEQAQNIKNLLIYCNYPELPSSVKINDVIQFDGGNFSGKIVAVHGRSVAVEIEFPGVLKSRQHINLPGVRILLPTISKQDENDIKFGQENNVDFIALSFVRNWQDIVQAKEIAGKKIGIISKIECQSGVDNFSEILKKSDGIMVARGDLGVEIPLEKVPIIQKNILSTLSKSEKFGIVATQMIDSMVENPRPTRAEVTDISTAVTEKADYLMLSDETAVGKFPLKSIEIMQKVIDYTFEEAKNTLQ